MIKRLICTLVLVAALSSGHSAAANALGDFFKRLGNSIAHPSHPQKPAHGKSQKHSRSQNNPKDSTTTPLAQPSPSPSPGTFDPTQPIASPTPSPTPVSPVVRTASSVPVSRGPRRDIPYGIPAPNRNGFVTSPYAPNQGLVDVRGFPSGTEVKDPYTGRVFLTP